MGFCHWRKSGSPCSCHSWSGTMWMAVFADVGVTVLAVLNAMRALKKG